MAASYGNFKGSGHDGHLGNSPAPNTSSELTTSQLIGEAENYVDAIMAT